MMLIRPFLQRRHNNYLFGKYYYGKKLLQSNHYGRFLSSSSKVLLSDYDLSSPECNVTENIASRIGKNLHRKPFHPLNIIHNKIIEYWNKEYKNNTNSSSSNSNNDNESTFHVFDNLSPITSIEQSFDLLRIPIDHVSRSYSDTYYINKQTVLRPHTSAHQIEILKQGYNNFLISGDVYRRDEIDKTHYPVFHQMEGVKMFNNNELDGLNSEQDQYKLIENDLKNSLEGLAKHLFGNVEMRWVDEYFPFTHPSYELEILYNENDWMEVLGCGVIHPEILINADRKDNEKGWAFGLGLERLAMVLFQIPDIRLFWSDDERFYKQFESGEINNIIFQPYSKYPPCIKDISFWINNDKTFHVNDLNEIIRNIADDLVEEVILIDQFVHPNKTNRTSHCYRIVYRSMDRSLTNDEIDTIQEQVRYSIVQNLDVELR